LLHFKSWISLDEGLEVLTRINTPLPFFLASLMKGRTLSVPRKGLTVTASTSKEFSLESLDLRMPRCALA